MSSVAAPLATSTIDPNDPRLTTEIHTDNASADAYRLPKGLIRLDGREIYVRPEIAKRMGEHALDNACELLIQGAESSANRLVACTQIYIVHSHCEEWHVTPGHDAEVSTGWCGQAFVCAHCRKPSNRIHAFRYAHPYLYEHLMHSAFSVLTFTADSAARTEIEVLEDLVWARRTFAEFSQQFDGDHGWYFLAAFSFDEEDQWDDQERMFPRTKFYAIHSGPDLPSSKRLSELWKTACGRKDSKVQKRTFYTSTEQKEGLLLAFSGFDEFIEGIDGYERRLEVDFSLAAAKMDDLFLTYPYGTFRGFDKRIEDARKAEGNGTASLCVDGKEHPPEAPKCRRCGKTMKRTDEPIIVPRHEMDERGVGIIWHIGPPIYGRFQRHFIQNTDLQHAPPS
jgi:hypothetical protein